MANGRGPDACFERVRDRCIERAVLGRVLLERGIPEELRVLRLAGLGDSLHRAIYAAIRAVQAQGRAVDCATVRDQMRRDGTLNDLAFAGGLFYLYECTNLYVALGKGALYAQRCCPGFLIKLAEAQLQAGKNQLERARAHLLRLKSGDVGGSPVKADNAPLQIKRYESAGNALDNIFIERFKIADINKLLRKGPA